MLLLRIALAALFVCSFSHSVFGQGSISCSADDVVLEVPTPHRVSWLERSGDLVAAIGNDGTLFYSVDSELTPTFLSEIPDTGVGVFGEEGAGQYYFVTGNDQMLNVYDVSDPKDPSKIGQFDLQDRASRIGVEGSYLFLLFSGQLRILDVADPSSPEVVSVLNTGEWASDLRVNDGVLYTAHRDDGILVVDVQDPTRPVIIAEHDIYASQLLTVGTTLIVSSGSHVWFYDSSDLRSLQLIGEYSCEGHWPIAVHGTSLYLSTNHFIDVVSFSDRQNPVRAGWYSTGDFARGVLLQDGVMLATNADSGLAKLDVTNPSDPQPTYHDVDLGELREVRSSFEVGDVAYLVDSDGVFAASTSGPDSHGPLVEVSMLRLSGVRVSGDRVVGVFSDNVVVAYDHNNPLAPEKLSHYSVGGGDILAIAFAGDMLCASVFSYGELLTLSDAGVLSSFGKNFMLHGATAMALQGEHLYGNFQEDFLSCIDISDPIKPQLVWESEHIEPNFMVLSDGFLYCDDEYGNESVFVLDLSVPSNPVVVSEIRIPSDVFAMSVHDERLFLSLRDYDVVVYDISDPSSPQLIGTYGPDMLDRPWEDRLPYTVDSDRAYHIDYNGGVLAYDITPQCNDCQADVNGDGSVTPDDFMSWINAFNNNLPACDQNGDRQCTPSDFTVWIANFNAGC
ncbi:MAG: hypothetical protein Phyf2KO_25980 [Phycisphaerales bacterium]